MSNYKRKEVMDYLTRKPVTTQDIELARTRIQTPAAPAPMQATSGEGIVKQPDFYEDKKPNMNDPGMIVDPLKILPKNFTDDMPFAPQQNVPGQQLELKTGGRVGYSEGSKLTGTNKTLEQNIKDDHKAYNDYRKSIGQSTIPLDNEYIKMWIRSRLNSGGPVKKESSKIIPLNLESVAFKLFQDKLDNLSYNQKQTVYDYIEDNRNKKADGGRIKLQNGTEETYNPEIPSLGETDPIGILEQRLINEKDTTKINAIFGLLDLAKKEQAAKEKAREEEKAAQKAKGVRYKEDFPSEAAYFAETGKQLLTNPKYFLSKGAKGIVEGTEFLIGQPLQTLFSQEGKNFELYQPVLGEKLGIDKYIEENIPKGATTGTLLAGDVAEIAGSVADPFLVYGLTKGAIKGVKPKPPTAAADETIDPTRRDILKTGAVMGAGAALYPTAKKLGMFDELAKGVKAVRVLPEVKGMPTWFNPLITKIEKEGLDITSQARKAQKLEYERFGGPPSNAADREIVQSKKLKIPVPGKKESETITITEYKNGDLYVESNTSGGAFDKPFELYYTAPKEVTETQFLRGKDGKVYEKKVMVKKEGDFTVLEERPQYASPRGYYDDSLELEILEFNADNAISDLERLEKIATGKKPKPEQIKKRKENREYVEKNPREDADSRLPDPSDYYDQ